MNLSHTLLFHAIYDPLCSCSSMSALTPSFSTFFVVLSTLPSNLTLCPIISFKGFYITYLFFVSLHDIFPLSLTSLCLRVYLTTYLSFFLFVYHLSCYPPIFLSIQLSIYLSFYLSIYQPIFSLLASTKSSIFLPFPCPISFYLSLSISLSPLPPPFSLRPITILLKLIKAGQSAAISAHPITLA